MQRGVTLIELLLCIAILSIFSSIAVPTIGQSVAKQEIENSARQLVADIRWLQQITINSGVDITAYALIFKYTAPYGYYITANTQRIKAVTFPTSVNLSGQFSTISFSLSGTPKNSAQSIVLYSAKLKESKYVILAPVTGRVRISSSISKQPEE